MSEKRYYIVQRNKHIMAFAIFASRDYVPADVKVWAVCADKVDATELRIYMREALKDACKAYRRWSGALSRLCGVRAAPAFAAYHRSSIAKLKAQEPNIDKLLAAYIASDPRAIKQEVLA